MESLYTTHDISRLLQVDPSTVSKWIDRGILLAFRTPGGHRRVRSGDLRSFLITHQMPVPDKLGSSTIQLLVVDDEKPVLDGLKRAFKPFANQVDIVITTSGVEALLLVSENKPHGMLVDLNMPDLDGLEVCRRIRARKTLEGVRLITMTARHSQEVVEQSLKAGAIACLPKPVDVQQVVNLFRVPMGLMAEKVVGQPMERTRSRVGDILVKSGVIDDLQLRSGMAHVEKWGGRLSHALVELGLADEDALATAMAEATHLSRLALATIVKDPQALSRIPLNFAETRGVFPVSLKDHGKTLTLACSDPTDLTIVDEAAGLSHARVQLVIAGEEEIARAIAKHYRNIDLPPSKSRARAAVERSQRHTSDENPVVSYPAAKAEEQEFSAEALGASPTATDMLEEMMAGSAEPGSAWTEVDRQRLKGLIDNQAKSSMVLDAVMALLVDKGFLRPAAYQAWRRGEPLPPVPQLRPAPR